MYVETLNYYFSKFNIQNFKVVGLLIGKRRTIQKIFQDFLKEHHFSRLT